MPRPNRTRTMLAERNTAASVAHLRQERDWSIERLAKHMEEAGCPIHPSAIYKLEKGDPPRRVTVDELVGFAMVFGVPLDELIRDPAERIPEQLVDLQEELLLQIALGNVLDELVKDVRLGQRQILDRWNQTVRNLPEDVRPEGELMPLGVEDEAPNAAIGWVIALARYEREIDELIRTTIRRRQRSRTSRASKRAKEEQQT